MKYVFFIISIISYIGAYGQSTFVKIIDKDETRIGYQITKHNENFIVTIAGVYNNSMEGTLVMEIDPQANLLWERNLPWIDISSGSLVVLNDTITLSGNHNPEQTEFYLHQMSVNGGDSLTTYIIDDDRIDLERMFQLSTIHYNNKFVIAGSARVVDTAYAIMYIVDDTTGEVDSLFIPDQNGQNTDIWDILEDQDGNLVAFFDIQKQDGTNVRSIRKYNTQFEEIWRYTSESLFINSSVPKGCELLDGRIALTYGHFAQQSQTHSIRVVNPDKSVDWQFDWPDNGSIGRTILKVETAADGSIFAMGRYSNLLANPQIRLSPFIIKISEDGERIWEHVYVELDEENEVKRGLIFDLEELDDGSLLALGDIRNDNGDILIMKLDSEGCLMEDCPEVSVFTDTEELAATDLEIVAYPNPLYTDMFTLRLPDDINLHNASYTIYNLMGQRIQNGILSSDTNLIRLDESLNGVFFIEVIIGNRKELLKLIRI